MFLMIELAKIVLGSCENYRELFNFLGESQHNCLSSVPHTGQFVSAHQALTVTQVDTSVCFMMDVVQLHQCFH